MKAPWLLLALLLPGGSLIVGLEWWRRRRARDSQPDLVSRWKAHLSSGPAKGEPVIPSAKVPALRPLKAVPSDRIERFRRRVAR